MNLQNLTEKAIEQFAGSVIFDRGYEYYANKQVSDLQYDAAAGTIQAQVTGHYDDYAVSIALTGGSPSSAECTCPYEGYPCKHVVAVLLMFLHDQEAYAQQVSASQKTESSLAKKVQALAKDELADILLACAKKYPDVKRDLMVRLESDKKATFETITRQIARAFPAVESHNYSIPNIARQLKTILKAVEQASPEMQTKVFWAVIDRTLKELDAYGIDDETLENVAIDAMENLAAAFARTDALHEEKAQIIERLLKYYQSGNFGITDWVYDTAVKLCKDKTEYQIVIQFLEKQQQRGSVTSYYQEQIAELYGAIGDTGAQRQTLEKNLRSGTDYWRLAEYWFEQSNHDKAWEIIHTGLEKGEGRKAELYAALQTRYQEQNDYRRILALLERKIEKKELEHRSLNADSTYQCLWAYYTAQNDYQGQTHLLELRLANNEIDLEFYKTAEGVFRVTDWQEFEPRMIRNLQTRLPERPPTSFGFGLFPSVPQGVTESLAEIYHYKHDTAMLFETVKNRIDLLRKYEAALMPQYPTDYLDLYRKKIDSLIKARGRENYQAAVAFVKALKKIYTDIWDKPNEWTQYLNNLRQENKTLRALQEELARF